MIRLTEKQAKVYEALRVATDRTSKGIADAINADVGKVRNDLLVLENKKMAKSTKIKTREGNYKEFTFNDVPYEIEENYRQLGKKPHTVIIDDSLPPASEVELTPAQWQFLRENERWWKYRSKLAEEMGLPKYMLNNALEKLRKQVERERAKKERKRA
ncbi:hypothetical protein WMW72_34080 [Paenibacillus filicis]|uniref:Uncharacterized protein n=1 Tax=Paenibacillus filicis TaxID=669464 RepID=A0ABU9DVN3_9BACL